MLPKSSQLSQPMIIKQKAPVRIISRPGRSQGLLYKHLCDYFIHSFINSVSHSFPPTALHRRHGQTVRDSSSSYKLDYRLLTIVIKNFLNSEVHENFISGSKVMAILLKGWICLLVELHQEGSASAACAACLFYSTEFLVSWVCK